MVLVLRVRYVYLPFGYAHILHTLRCQRPRPGRTSSFVTGEDSTGVSPRLCCVDLRPWSDALSGVLALPIAVLIVIHTAQYCYAVLAASVPNMFPLWDMFVSYASPVLDLPLRSQNTRRV